MTDGAFKHFVTRLLGQKRPAATAGAEHAPQRNAAPHNGAACDAAPRGFAPQPHPHGPNRVDNSLEGKVLRFERGGDRGPQDRLQVAEAYMKLERPRDAARVFGTFAPDNRGPRIKMRMATALLQSGSPHEAAEVLRTIKPGNLKAHTNSTIVKLRFQAIQAMEGPEAAYEYLKARATWDGFDTPVVQMNLYGVERRLGHLERARSRIWAGLDRFGGNEAYVRFTARMALDDNLGDVAYGLARLNRAQNPASPLGRLLYLDTLWHTGRLDELAEAIAELDKPHLEHLGVLRFINQCKTAVAPALDTCKRASRILEAGTRGGDATGLPMIARGLLALDDFTRARAVADRYLSDYPISPVAYYARGAAAYFLGDNEAAEHDLLACVALNPGFYEAHVHLLNILPRKPDGLDHVGRLLDEREKVNPRYLPPAPDGRRGILDVERSQHCAMIGDMPEAFRLRLERPLCQTLSAKFPRQYAHFKDPSLPKERKGSLLVISEDGVGDEVRWAQFYPKLHERYERVVVVCEPRFETLFRRSFPDLEIAPVARRWMEKPANHPDPRAAIDDLQIARYVTKDLYDRFDDFSEVRLTADVARGFWAEAPDGGPSPSGAGAGAYITPDPERRAALRRVLQERAAGRRVVGVLWRSALITPRRSKHYVDLSQLEDLFKAKGVYFVSIQDATSEEERELCRKYGVDLVEDLVDFHDDFEGIAALGGELDLMVGSASLNSELTAATGTPCWLLGGFCNLVHFRTGNRPSEMDLISWNTRVIRADIDVGFGYDDDAHIKKVVAMAKADLEAFARTKDARGPKMRQALNPNLAALTQS